MTLETIVYSLEEQLRLLSEQMLETQPQEKLQEKLQDDLKENEEMLQRRLEALATRLAGLPKGVEQTAGCRRTVNLTH